MAELVRGEPGISGTDGGMSEGVPDDGERGVCGDDREGLCRSYDLRLRGLRSLTGLPGSALLLLTVDGVLSEIEPS